MATVIHTEAADGSSIERGTVFVFDLLFLGLFFFFAETCVTNESRARLLEQSNEVYEFLKKIIKGPTG